MSAENETLSRAEHLVRVVNPCPRCERLERLFVRYIAHMMDVFPRRPPMRARDFARRFDGDDLEKLRRLAEQAEHVRFEVPE